MTSVGEKVQSIITIVGGAILFIIGLLYILNKGDERYSAGIPFLFLGGAILAIGIYLARLAKNEDSTKIDDPVVAK